METTIQLRKPWRILAGFVQCLGILVVLASILNLFLSFAPLTASVGGLVLGAILYILGMLGGTKAQVSATTRLH